MSMDVFRPIRREDIPIEEVISYAQGEIIDHINAPKWMGHRKSNAEDAAMTLNQIIGGRKQPRLSVSNSIYKVTDVFAIEKPVIDHSGEIEGTLLAFEPLYYDPNREAPWELGQIVLALILTAKPQKVVVDGVEYTFDSLVQYRVDLAQTIGPFEQVEEAA